jgi:hypothetical protein
LLGERLTNKEPLPENVRELERVEFVGRLYHISCSRRYHEKILYPQLLHWHRKKSTTKISVYGPCAQQACHFLVHSLAFCENPTLAFAVHAKDFPYRAPLVEELAEDESH